MVPVLSLRTVSCTIWVLTFSWQLEAAVGARPAWKMNIVCFGYVCLYYIQCKLSYSDLHTPKYKVYTLS
jgi:hypothetical protein